MTKDKMNLLIESALELRNARLRAKQHGIISYQSLYRDEKFIDEFQMCDIALFKELAAAAGKNYNIELLNLTNYPYQYCLILDGIRYICLAETIKTDEDWIILMKNAEEKR